MKYINKLFLLSALLISTSACETFLNPEPAQSVDAATFPGDIRGVETMMVGAYFNLGDNDLAGSNFIQIPEIMTDNTIWTGSFTSYTEISGFPNQPITTNNAEVAGMWNDAYETISACNLILEALDNLDPNGDEAGLRGEAHFIRGYLFFELTRWFGQQYGASSGSDLGPIIELVPISTLAEFIFPSRQTVQAGYDQAISDLTQAQTLLATAGQQRVGGATALAATAMLMRIRMQQQDYATAQALAQQIFDAEAFQLIPTYQDFFLNEFNAESIFEMIFTITSNAGVNSSLSANFGGRSAARDDIDINTAVVDPLFDQLVNQRINDVIAADAGLSGFVDERFTLRVGNNTDKYEDDANNADNVPILRYAEVLLSLAECRVRTTGAVDQIAIDLVNQVRARSLRGLDANGNTTVVDGLFDYLAADFADADALLAAILLERRIELLFEGQHFFDLKRMGMDINGLPFNDNFVIFPIPQGEIDANGQNVIQNPGY